MAALLGAVCAAAASSCECKKPMKSGLSSFDVIDAHSTGLVILPMCLDNRPLEAVPILKASILVRIEVKALKVNRFLLMEKEHVGVKC